MLPSHKENVIKKSEKCQCQYQMSNVTLRPDGGHPRCFQPGEVGELTMVVKHF